VISEVDMDVLSSAPNYMALSVKDLLTARDLYHWHLTQKENVVGTAVGLYYIRRSDPWPGKDAREVRGRKRSTRREARTFANSEVRDYSWPSVLVLVEHWLDPSDFGSDEGRVRPDEMVPSTLYLPDGRSVPVCVIEVGTTEPDRVLQPAWAWTSATLGGGCPLFGEAQGQTYQASVGCLVTDGFTTYALTSRHVTGPAGHPVNGLVKGRQTEVGVSAARQLIRVPFSEAYPEYPGIRTWLTLDAGLVEVHRLDQWSSQPYGLPAPGELADLSEHNVTTRLIDAPVVAYGAASGRMTGRIAGLFLRWRSRGGYDDVTDFLIAPDEDSRYSQPGDSGTVWHLHDRPDDTAATRPDDLTGARLRPIAIQWGGQGITTAGRDYNVALAASLTTVIRLLDVDLVTDHNTHAQPFWGKTGHYTIGALACETVTSPRLAALMTANQDRISFPVSGLDAKAIDEATVAAKKAGTFMPLADVPDLTWKNLPTRVPGGRDTTFNQGPEHPNHYADIDEPDHEAHTLRELSLADPAARLTVEAWQALYTAAGHTAAADRGLLPFRVWQFFDVMVAAVEAGDVPRFVAAAGLVTHYVGDACQPLHGSVYANGYPPGSTTPGLGAGVHSAYENDMVDRFDSDILTGVRSRLTPVDPGSAGAISSGHDAALAVVSLMDRTAQALPPRDLVDTYAATQTSQAKAAKVSATQTLWEHFGDATVAAIADGVTTLGTIWQAAWTGGDGEQRVPEAGVVAVDTTALQALYQDPAFVPSLDLDHIAPQLISQVGAPAAAPPR
jgi:hypothetical protein